MSKPVKLFLDHCIPPEHRWKIDLFSHWERIIGSMKDRVAIQKVDADTLYLSVYHPAWAQEISLLAPTLKRSLNKIFSEPRIKHIKFCAPTPAPNQRTHIYQQNEHYKAQQEIPAFALTQQECGALSTVKNTDLSKAITEYLNRCKSMQRRKHEL